MKLSAIALLFTLSVSVANAQQVETIKFEDLEELMSQRNDEYLVVNFWATWCKPCIQELPEFEKLNESGKAKVYLVSLDFVEDLEKVQRFVEKKGLTSDILLLDDMNYDSFIPKVSEEWTGAIPATLMIDSKEMKTAFYEKQFHEGELSEVFNSFSK